jgi:hypothetical protein
VADKDTALSITIRAVDRATAVIRAIGAKIAAVAKPTIGFLKVFAQGRRDGDRRDAVAHR